MQKRHFSALYFASVVSIGAKNRISKPWIGEVENFE